MARMCLVGLVRAHIPLSILASSALKQVCEGFEGNVNSRMFKTFVSSSYPSNLGPPPRPAVTCAATGP